MGSIRPMPVRERHGMRQKASAPVADRTLTATDSAVVLELNMMSLGRCYPIREGNPGAFEVLGRPLPGVVVGDSI